MAAVDRNVVLARIDVLCRALEHEPPSPVIVQALHQCDRLRQAVLQSHAEGLRFAAFTLTRLMQQTGANLQGATQNAARALKAGLDEAGYGA
jgi:hypothetical protein